LVLKQELDDAIEAEERVLAECDNNHSILLQVINLLKNEMRFTEEEK